MSISYKEHLLQLERSFKSTIELKKPRLGLQEEIVGGVLLLCDKNANDFIELEK